MLNEWRANIWLVVELIIVVLVLQFVFGMLYSLYDVHRKAVDVDLDDIYVASLNTKGEGSDGYVPYDSVHSRATDLDMLLVKLRSNPYVELVGTGSYNALPYHYNFWGDQILEVGDTTGRGYQLNRRNVSPEIMQIFEIHGSNGETPEQLADFIRKGQIVISGTEYSWDPESREAADFLGRDVVWSNDTLSVYHVAAIGDGMRRTDYEPTHAGTGYMPVTPDVASVVAIRVKPGMGHKFTETLGSEDRQAGNLYMTSLKTLESMRDSCQMSISQSVRSVTVCALFVLTMVFLGFLGTFWFRTQQRVPEVAIRKINGATNGDIYRRFFAEGMLLLAVATVVSLPVTVWIVTGLSDVTGMSFYGDSVGVAAVMTVVIIAMMIIAGIYAPARKAAAISPAEALKDM